MLLKIVADRIVLSYLFQKHAIILRKSNAALTYETLADKNTIRFIINVLESNLTGLQLT